MSAKTSLIIIFALLLSSLFLVSCSGGGDDDDSGGGSGDDDDDTTPDDDDDDTSPDDDDDNDDDDDDDYATDMEGWVVGYSNTGGQTSSIIWHADHGIWGQETLPFLNQLNGLNDVLFLAPDNGWAVGFETNGTANGVILHRDATGWSKEVLPGTPCTFAQVEFLDADHGWAICDEVIDTLAYRYDTGTWTAIPFPWVVYDAIILSDVSLLTSDHAFVSGVVTVPSGSAVFLEYLNGTVTDMLPSSYFDWYEGMQIAQGNEGYLAYCTWRASFYPPSIYQFNGTTWQLTSELLDAGCVSDFARSPSGVWYAAGYDEEPSIHKKQLTGWLKMVLPSSTGFSMWNGLQDIDMPTNDFGVAVGGSEWLAGPGYAFRFNGTNWHEIDDIQMNDTVYKGVSFVFSP